MRVGMVTLAFMLGGCGQDVSEPAPRGKPSAAAAFALLKAKAPVELGSRGFVCVVPYAGTPPVRRPVTLWVDDRRAYDRGMRLVQRLDASDVARVRVGQQRRRQVDLQRLVKRLRGEVPTTIAAVTSIVLRDEHGASTCPPVSVLLESSSRGERAAHHRWIRRLPRRFGADRVVVSPADQAFLDG